MARLTGKEGSIYLAQSSTKLADSFLWELEETMDLAECSIKGEPSGHYIPVVTNSRVRVQSFVSGPSPLTSLMDADRVAATGAGTPVNFALFMRDSDASGGTTASGQILGAGWIMRAQQHVARDGLITDEIEIQVEGGLRTVD